MVKNVPRAKIGIAITLYDVRHHCTRVRVASKTRTWGRCEGRVCQQGIIYNETHSPEQLCAVRPFLGFDSRADSAPAPIRITWSFFKFETFFFVVTSG